jgi:hypothetical protein
MNGSRVFRLIFIKFTVMIYRLLLAHIMVVAEQIDAGVS